MLNANSFLSSALILPHNMQVFQFTLREKCPYSEFSGPYSVRMRENTDQKNSEYGHFSSSVRNSKLVTLRLKISRLNSILCKNIINNTSNKKNKVTRRNNQENKMTMHKINVFIPQRTDVTSITRAMLEPAS